MLTALFVYLGTPRSKGIGSNGATEVGAGISLKSKINGLGGKIFSFRHKLPMPTNWISSGKFFIPALIQPQYLGEGAQ